jgi:hypothetical protein
MMKKTILLCLALSGLMFGACLHEGKITPEKDENAMADSLSQPLSGDSTVYGLVCDGCTDTILIFLPLSNIAMNPDTFNILEAMRQHRVLGTPDVGDKVAIVRNGKDSMVADYVIDMNDLVATWSYQVLPTLHRRANMNGLSNQQAVKQLNDSLRQLLSIPQEYSLLLNVDNTARSTGHYRHDDDSPVEYPRLKRYGEWQLYNGKLLLTQIGLDTLGNRKKIETDTAELLLLGPDTLVLRFADGMQSYYRKE